ncbi:MAG: 16S rRNA (cytosine(967)-C(5))-methyltransferase RsmB [Legionellaceae bacterium]|nr:16S rRNA (cytosine(967)-C(5))-methyltransferase RsmB [Legionellaceae bacterium]
MKKTERLQAVTILKSVLQQKTPLSHVLKTNPTPTPLTKEICFGVCRHYIRLEALANSLLTKRPKEIDVWLCILIGLYQLHFLNIPDYAVVQETVALLDQLKKTWAKGLVNAILRRYCREKDILLSKLDQNIAYQYGHPAWFIKQIKNDWPNDWQSILTANDQHPPMSLRVNQQRTNIRDYLTCLHENDMDAALNPNTPDGLILSNACSVHDLPGFAEGLVSVQDTAAQLAASLLDLKPNLRVLDACCAPGGKTCHILEMEPELAECIALDIEPHRLERVRENLARLMLPVTLQEGDALSPTKWWDGVLFDRILLDAPCSATGVIRRNPDIKLLRTPDEIKVITQLQQGILTALWPLLAPGGRLVYATCSIMPVENEQQIAQFVEQHDDCEYLTDIKPWGHSTGHGWQILPGEENMDGFFYSILIKKIS